MWDIRLVLQAFLLAPFELLGSASFQSVTYKTSVLIVFTLGAHKGKLCALRHGQFTRPAEDWSFVLLYSDPLYIPKTAKRRLSAEPYKLRALLPSTVYEGRHYGLVRGDPSFFNNQEIYYFFC